MTQTMRKTTELEQCVCEYLNDLRLSGVVNMFGAGPYVESEFGLTKQEVRPLLTLWMSNFNNEGDYLEVKE
jgi:hypothetical protein